jgi:hypothetical protein
LGRLIEDIEGRADAGTIDLGFLLLMLGSDAIKNTNRAIEQLVAKTRRNQKVHDLTICLDDAGFTVHSSDLPVAAAAKALRRHCEVRKYTQRAGAWFGVCLGSGDARLRFGVSLDYPWKEDADLEERTKRLAKPSASILAASQRQTTGSKVGRNDRCPCGSGLKYKKCCLR